MNLCIKKVVLCLFALISLSASAQDLAEIRSRGVLRHLGVPYARFVIGNDSGLDAEVIQLFAKHIGVRYEYVPTDWHNVIEDLIGQGIQYKPVVHAHGSRPIKGDIVGNGLTILPAREALIDYSVPTFPSAVWLLTRADFPVEPIKPSGNITTDIEATKAKLTHGSTFVMENTCLDSKAYGLDGKGYRLLQFTKSINLNDIVPAVLKREADMTLLDVPDVIVAMEKWPGQIKIIGPVSGEQRMGIAFRKTSPALRQAFNEFFVKLQNDGTYMRLVKKYYRAAPRYLPDYFRNIPGER
ncbi:transporter substrate-binding domain-containing protein [Propionivibrio limicola]|uniref:transporter substrate-binding domain-containing protein n=1 Tax=Propionivibrio limicola TaxID=167645 RepID=UPI001290BF47|nr:transporter substrate-binding domain-containing protein [Propionivibrio limicola]